MHSSKRSKYERKSISWIFTQQKWCFNCETSSVSVFPQWGSIVRDSHGIRSRRGLSPAHNPCRSHTHRWQTGQMWSFLGADRRLWPALHHSGLQLWTCRSFWAQLVRNRLNTTRRTRYLFILIMDYKGWTHKNLCHLNICRWTNSVYKHLKKKILRPKFYFAFKYIIQLRVWSHCIIKLVLGN